MPVKPTQHEDEYFAREEMEKRRRIAEQRQAKMQVEQRERERALHYMKCPKCGMQLEEITFSGVQVDKCFHCEGLWLDKGEIEAIQAKEPGFVGRLLSAFRP